MKKIGLKSYRFSISWARIYPDASGKVNEKGLQFYKNLVDELVKAGIEPMCTLFHWDLPMWLYEKGAWETEEGIDAFVQYAATCVEALSDKIKYWLTFNEPECFVDAGYGSGAHAPFLKVGQERLLAVTRGVMLAHGMAVKKMREVAKQPILIGSAQAACVTSPVDETPEEIEKARVSTFETSRPCFCSWWGDPVYLGKRQVGTNYLSDEDLKIICQPLDFFAFNMYTADGYGARITVDFSVVNSMKYYSGIAMSGYVSGVPERILSGGRYDKLMRRMGKAAGAIGFALYLNALEAMDGRK